MKRRFLFSYFTAFLIFITAPMQGSARQTAEQSSKAEISPETTEFIIRTVINKTKGNEPTKRKNFSYQRTYTTYDLDNNEQISERDKKEIVSIERGGREKLISRNDKPVSRSEQDKPSGTSFDLIRVLESMARLDEFVVASIEMIDDRLYYVILFKPKPNARADGDVEQIVIRSEGKMYVDVEKFYIHRLSASMTKSYSRAWGIFVLSRANVNMEQEDLNEAIVMKSVTMLVKYSLFGSSTFQLREYLYNNYQQQK